MTSDLLDRRGGHDGTPDRVRLDVGARGEPAGPDRRQRRDRLADAPFGARDGALCREARLVGRLALDIGVEAALDHRHRNAGDQRSGDHRNRACEACGESRHPHWITAIKSASSVKAGLRFESVSARTLRDSPIVDADSRGTARWNSDDMEALFIGQTYIDVTFLIDRIPTGDEKVGRARLCGELRRQCGVGGVLLRQARHRAGPDDLAGRRLARAHVPRHGGEVRHLGARPEGARNPRCPS